MTVRNLFAAAGTALALTLLGAAPATAQPSGGHAPVEGFETSATCTDVTIKFVNQTDRPARAVVAVDNGPHDQVAVFPGTTFWSTSFPFDSGTHTVAWRISRGPGASADWLSVTVRCRTAGPIVLGPKPTPSRTVDTLIPRATSVQPVASSEELPKTGAGGTAGWLGGALLAAGGGLLLARRALNGKLTS